MRAYSELEMADRHIAQTLRHIAEQRERVLELRRRGEDDTFSQSLLANMIYGLVVQQTHRDTLAEELARNYGQAFFEEDDLDQASDGGLDRIDNLEAHPRRNPASNESWRTSGPLTAAFEQARKPAQHSLDVLPA